MLLSPTHFKRVRELISSLALLAAIGSSELIGFSLPPVCPMKTPHSCKVVEQEVTEIEASEDITEAPEELNEIEGLVPVVDETETEEELVPDDAPAPPLKKPRKKRTPVLVDSQVRRSPRIKKNSKGFKTSICKDKQCLGCNTKPPTLSNNAIRKLGSSLCDIDVANLSDGALSSKKKKQVAPVGTLPPSNKGPEEIQEDGCTTVED